MPRTPRPSHALTIAVAVAATGLLASGCGAVGDEGADAELSVAAGFYPLAWVTEQVAGEHAEVVTLSRPGQDAHDAEITIGARATLAEADLVVLSSGFQPAVDAAAEDAQGQVLDAAEVLEFREVTDHSDHDHGDEEHGDEESDDGHDHGDTDPHFWLDPLLMAQLAEAVSAELGELAPDRASDFAANTDALRAELEQLDADYTETLARCERTTVVVSHDAFGYLSRYGLEFEPIAGLSPGAEPTPADLARLQRLIEDEGVTTVFNEVLASTKLTETLARDAGVETAVLDPVEGVTGDADADTDYLSLMRDNLSALSQANGC
ncbi:zinc ABC transporter substrate-binding protein [Nocardioides sp. Y6]|uniref:Zinc ABC transporter substrate-binding protein n=1 Tax=Nocardioides malaquae TaxID=2773426 RepID=A0ABR9RQ69_9ACTN|nr:metal ABC transporter substrate-binding protein [Nocardioides malaquae]MBE7323706.1 zinc ABC transporter substrate-binding protein [Nocardioides malaquae]